MQAPPPPELAPLEYARRPIEITPEFALGLPSCADGSVDNERCVGLSAGAGGGMSVLWRPTPFFAFGGAFDELRFRFDPGPSSGLRGVRATGQFVGLLGRVYFMERGVVEPYLELGLGSGRFATRARALSGFGDSSDESASGVAVRAGGGVEFYLSPYVRLGPAFAWTTIDVKRVRHCDGSGCVDLDQGSYGHGTGFGNFALRLSIVLGPGL